MGAALVVSMSAVFIVVDENAVVASASAGQCRDMDAADLNRLFQGQFGRVGGGDYLRSFRLPGGETLVLMQDVFLAPRGARRAVVNLGAAVFVHNAGVVLDDRGCLVRTLTGTRSFIGSNMTRSRYRWFWPMGGGMGADGLLHVVVAEFRNPNGTGAGVGAAPVATWHATIDPASMTVRSFVPAADASAALYGWAVASDAAYTYLYAYCYRQFIPGEMLGHDLSCSGRVTVGRVSLGHFDEPPEYYGADGWSSDPDGALPVDFPGDRAINPVSIQNIDGTFFSVSKEGDWWGSTIFVDSAPSAVGPWTAVTTLVPAPKCGGCNTYYASLMPWRQPNGSLVVALSNNAWNMRRDAYPSPWLYRNSFIEIPLPA